MSNDPKDFDPRLVEIARQIIDDYGLAVVRSALNVADALNAIEAEQARKTPPKVRWADYRPDPDDVRALEAWVEERLRDGDL